MAEADEDDLQAFTELYKLTVGNLRQLLGCGLAEGGRAERRQATDESRKMPTTGSCFTSAQRSPLARVCNGFATTGGLCRWWASSRTSRLPS